MHKLNVTSPDDLSGLVFDPPIRQLAVVSPQTFPQLSYQEELK
jgi:hypothetical protein